MSLMPGYEDGVYFNDEELDGIGWIVADNLSHTYRSQGADFSLVDVQHGYNFDKNEYIISVTCQCVSHYDPEVFSRKEYGPYLDSVDGQDFTATRTFQYNRFDTHNTMGRSLAIDLTEDIENQIRAGVKKFNGGVTASRRIKASIDSDISRYKKALESKAAKKGLYENFGQAEIRKLRDKYSTLPDGSTDYSTAKHNRDSLASFESWCRNYVCASTKVVATSYDTKIIAKYLKKKFDDEAFGTSHSSSLGSFYRNNPNDPDIYMNRNGLRYNSRNNTITDRDDNPVFKVIPQYSHPKRQGVYPPKLPKIVPIDEWNATHNVESCDKITGSLQVDTSTLEPRQRTAVDGKTWWVVFDTATGKYSTYTCFGKYKTKKDCQYAIDHCEYNRDKVTGSINSEYGKDMVKFFYKGEFLGACDPEYMECEALYDLMESDKAVASQVLNYMNSLGDPVFPVSEDDWGTPETNVDNVDINELYNTFMQELEYSYSDFPDEFYVGGDYLLPDFEIFIGEVAEDDVIK